MSKSARGDAAFPCDEHEHVRVGHVGGGRSEAEEAHAQEAAEHDDKSNHGNNDDGNNGGGDDDLLMGWNHQVRRRMSNQSAASGSRRHEDDDDGDDDDRSNEDEDDHQQQEPSQQRASSSSAAAAARRAVGSSTGNNVNASSSASATANSATATATATAPTSSTVGQSRSRTSASTTPRITSTTTTSRSGSSSASGSSSTTTAGKTTSKPKKPRRNVRFNPSVRFVRVRGRWQYTPNEYASVWYDQDEYDDIRHRMRKSVKRMRKRLHRSGHTCLSANTIALLELETERESTRGLEHLTSIPVLEQHREEYELVKHRVLSTQAEQWKTGNLCAVEIARASRSVTEESSTRAVRKAIKDTIDASSDMALDCHGRAGAGAGAGAGVGANGNNSMRSLNDIMTNLGLNDSGGGHRSRNHS